jgi:UDP-sugar transporter A1/2/3
MKRLHDSAVSDDAALAVSTPPKSAITAYAPPPARWLKPVSLVLMLVQNAAFVLVMRFSRKQQAGATSAQTYSIGMVVALQEAFKMIICFAVLAAPPAGSLWLALEPLTRPRELLNIAVPAFCFTLQNNILYVALSNLDALTFQITYQLKTLLTALFSVVLLGKQMSGLQWLSQLTLMVGIILAQLADTPPASGGGSGKILDVLDVLAPPPAALSAAAAAPPPPALATTPTPTRSLTIGLAAVLTAALSSAFASVYFERLLKEKPAPAPLPPPLPAHFAEAGGDGGTGAAGADGCRGGSGGSNLHSSGSGGSNLHSSGSGGSNLHSSGSGGSDLHSSGGSGSGSGSGSDGGSACGSGSGGGGSGGGGGNGSGSDGGGGGGGGGSAVVGGSGVVKVSPKPAPTSLWVRNVELCAWTVPLNLALALESGHRTEGGMSGLLHHPLRGFEPSTWAVIVVNGFGGLLVAIVIKYADNIWKGFATAGAIVATGAVAPLLDLGPSPNALLIAGTTLVIISLFMYALPPRAPRPQPGSRLREV